MYIYIYIYRKCQRTCLLKKYIVCVKLFFKFHCILFTSLFVCLWGVCVHGVLVEVRGQLAGVYLNAGYWVWWHVPLS